MQTQATAYGRSRLNPVLKGVVGVVPYCAMWRAESGYTHNPIHDVSLRIGGVGNSSHLQPGLHLAGVSVPYRLTRAAPDPEENLCTFNCPRADRNQHQDRQLLEDLYGLNPQRLEGPSKVGGCQDIQDQPEKNSPRSPACDYPVTLVSSSGPLRDASSRVRPVVIQLACARKLFAASSALSMKVT